MPTYIGRLSVNNHDLKSPNSQIVQGAYDALFELWLEYAENQNFINDLKKTIKENSNLVQEFTNRLNKLHLSEDKKAILLKKIIALYSHEALQEVVSYTQEKNKSKITPKIFISYSHKDEIFKNELIIMLAGMQRRNIIEVSARSMY